MPTPTLGTQAPNFTLASTGGSITLSDYRDKKNVLLAFFPLAFTSTCTAEMCAFTDDYAQFEAEQVAVIPISVDSTATLKEFKAKHKMAVELASDFKRDVSRAYGVLNDEKFYSNRAYFIIDKAGMVRWSHVETVSGEWRETKELLAAIAGLPR